MVSRERLSLFAVEYMTTQRKSHCIISRKPIGGFHENTHINHDASFDASCYCRYF